MNKTRPLPDFTRGPSNSSTLSQGKILKIILEEPQSKLANLRPRPYLLSDPEDLVHLDWSAEGCP